MIKKQVEFSSLKLKCEHDDIEEKVAYRQKGGTHTRKVDIHLKRKIYKHLIAETNKGSVFLTDL